MTDRTDVTDGQLVAGVFQRKEEKQKKRSSGWDRLVGSLRRMMALLMGWHS